MPKNSTTAVYDAIINELCNNRIRPGELLPPEVMLSTRFNISRSTMRKVLRRLAEQGFIVSRPGIGWELLTTPSLSAGSDRVWRIGIGINGTGGVPAFHDRIVVGIRAAAAHRNCHLMLFDYHDPNKISDDAPDAIIMASPVPRILPQYVKFAEKRGPFLLINRMPDYPRFSCFAVDYVGMSRRAVEYLMLLGHRKIGFVNSGSTPSYSEALRCDGWRKAFEAAGLAASQNLVFGTTPYNVMVEKLKEQRPTALLLAREMELAPTMQALAKCGMSVPEDVSLVCFDDLGDLPELPHAVSYVRMPLFNMGYLALLYVLNALENVGTPPLRKLFEADLAINSSCRKLSEK